MAFGLPAGRLRRAAQGTVASSRCPHPDLILVSTAPTALRANHRATDNRGRESGLKRRPLSRPHRRREDGRACIIRVLG